MFLSYVTAVSHALLKFPLVSHLELAVMSLLLEVVCHPYSLIALIGVSMLAEACMHVTGMCIT